METNLFRYIWQKSRSEQIVVLAIILASIPFYWISFDVPKKIVNDAIQGRAFKDGHQTATFLDIGWSWPDWLGGGSVRLYDGFQVGQMGLLFGLSGYFLLLVLINGAFKYVINVRKGILGERMLRRMRYDLFGQLMRFPPDRIRSAKPAEVASMIKDEVEPIGGFVGDAFIQPVFLLSQALTALAFIMMQNIWLGSIALGIVLIQAVIIPILRREQLRLGRERQVASRQLAGRIGEIVDAGPTIQGHGATGYVQADISGRLGRLFDIRYDLYKRKFAVKFLNNLLAQLTPFFFYAVGGYFALNGRLDIGQLVAVIAAYRDLPPPIKELIDWDQQRNDVTIKYEQVVNQFNSDDALLLDDPDPGAPLPERGEIRLSGVQLLDNRGQPLIMPLSLTVQRPGLAAIVGPNGGAREVLGRILGRETMVYSGRVTIDRQNLASFSIERASRLIGYAGTENELIAGTLRDNIVLPLKRARPKVPDNSPVSAADHRRFIESLRSGNTPLPFEADWVDYEGAGVADADALDERIRALLDLLGGADQVYELGLDGKVELPLPEEAVGRIIEARQAVAAEIARSRFKRLIEPFDPARYNRNATIGENLVFGTRRTPRFANANLLFEPYAKAILTAEALVEPLIEMGSRIVQTVVEIFEGLPAGHALFERYSFGVAIDFERLQELAATLGKHDMRGPIDPDSARDLVALALGYIEPKHRLNLLDAALQRRLLRARASFQAHFPADGLEDVDFYARDKVMNGASVRDNLMFGRVGYDIPDAEAKTAAILREALSRSGLETALYRFGLDTECGLRGRYLPTKLKLLVPLAQALIKRPRIAILDISTLVATNPDPSGLITRLREHCSDATLFLLLDDAALADGIRPCVIFDGASGKVEYGDAGGAPPAQREGQGKAATMAEART